MKPDLSLRARHSRPTPHPFRLAAVALCLAASTGYAADFTINGADTTARTLGSASGQTGNVTVTGLLTVGGATVAVTITGNNATLNNLGSIVQTGSGRTIRDNTGVTNLVVNNGSATNGNALLQAADGDVIQMNRPASVTLNNFGQMISLNASAGGSQAVDFSAITAGANVVNNYATGLMRAVEADAVRPGVNGVVYNAGRIVSVTAAGSSSDGIDFQSNGGGRITNDAGGLVEGGRHGITGGAADATVTFAASITNNAGARVQGDNGSGLNFDGFNARQLVTIVNAGNIVGNGVTGDGDGVDVDGLVAITNSGVIRSTNAFSPLASGLAYSEGLTVGGGSIANSGTIEGLVAAGNTNAVGRGITLAGNDITTGPLAGTREAIYGNTTITNATGGLIRGQSDSAITVDGARSGFTVTIDNAAGATLRGGGTTNAAVRTGLDNDTLTNAGTIDGSSSGKAVDLGRGNNTMNILGGQAFIVGDVDGGAGGTNLLAIDLGAGHRFAYAGSLSNFANVEAKSGTTTLSGASTYTGTTRIDRTATLVLDGADRLSAASTLELAGGTLQVVDAARTNGQTFARLVVDTSSTIDLGGSALTFDALGNVVDDAMLTITGFFVADASRAAFDYAIRFAGDLSGDTMFRTLLANTTVDGRLAGYRFDGAFTNVVAAVPEPGTVTLIFAGLGVAAWTARRRRARG